MLRHLNWNGCFNARDLGGLKLSNGQETLWGSIIRADSLDKLTLDDWRDVENYGVRTVIDMRSDFERTAISEHPVFEQRDSEHDISKHHISAIRTIHRPLEDQQDAEFWTQWLRFSSTPIYYGAFLTHCPANVAGIFREIAQAQAGGVIFHCARGRDRTGLIAILLLALAGVTSSEIVDDYNLSAERLKARPGQETEEAKIDKLLAQEETTSPDEILSLLNSFDAEAYLLKASLSSAEIAAVRSRLAPGQ
jgi:protein tyrosine/serine phosphatase